MEKSIATVMLTIAAIVGVAGVVNVVMPAVNRAGNALVSSADVADDRLSSRVDIIHATGVDAVSQADVWVKNTGAIKVTAVQMVDIFFGEATDFQRIPYGGPSCGAPCWEYTIENDTVWNPTATLHIIIYTSSALSAGSTYYVKVVTSIGVEDTKFFTL